MILVNPGPSQIVSFTVEARSVKTSGGITGPIALAITPNALPFTISLEWESSGGTQTYTQVLDSPDVVVACYLSGAVVSQIEPGDVIERAAALRDSAEAIRGGDHARAWAILEPWLDSADAGLLCNASTAALRCGRPEQAARLARRACEADPKGVIPAYALAQALFGNDDEGAVRAAREALRRDPRFALAHGVLGAALMRCRQPELAHESYVAALALDPALPHVWHNLGHAELALGRVDAAMAAFERRLGLDDDDTTRLDLGMAQLWSGLVEPGWLNYESRWKLRGQIPRFAELRDVPVWDGGPLEGRRIALVAEQGHGDGLQFVRYASVLADRGATVVVFAHRNQTRLFATVRGVASAVAFGDAPPEVDLQVPMLSVPRLAGLPAFASSPPTPTFEVPPDPRPRLEGRAIGVHPGCGPVLPEKGFPLRALAPLAAIEGVRLYNVEFGDRSAELASCGFAVDDLGPFLGDFYDTGRVIVRLDAVVTADTAMAHLAAGLGVPTFVILPRHADWRWGGVGERTPSYSSMHLVRRGDDLDVAVARVCAAIAALCLSLRPAPPAAPPCSKSPPGS